MIDRVTFGGYVEEAIQHLYEHAYLQAHPLATLLGVGTKRRSGGETLHRVLVEAVDELQPPRNASRHSLIWRSYYYLLYRYVEGQSPLEVARRLGISEDSRGGAARKRCARWRRLSGSDTSRREPRSQALPRSMGSALLRPMMSKQRLRPRSTRSVAGANAWTALSDVLGGVIDMVGPVAARRAITLRQEIQHDLPLLDLDFGRSAPGHSRDRARDAGSRWRGCHYGEGSSSDISRSRRGRHRARGPETLVATTARPEPVKGRMLAAQRLIEALGGTLNDDPRSGVVTLGLPSSGTVCVLVVDDNPDVLYLFRRYLSGGRYPVVEAQDVATALRLVDEVKPQVITLDLMMPMRDGWELLQTLRRHPETRDTPVLVCSVLKERELALMLGATGFLASR